MDSFFLHSFFFAKRRVKVEMFSQTVIRGQRWNRLAAGGPGRTRLEFDWLWLDWAGLWLALAGLAWTRLDSATFGAAGAPFLEFSLKNVHFPLKNEMSLEADKNLGGLRGNQEEAQDTR